MRFKSLAALTAAILLTSGCSKSLDDRFDDMCKKSKAANLETQGFSPDTCTYRQHLTEQQKLQLVESFELYWTEKENLDDLIDYGERRGWNTD